MTRHCRRTLQATASCLLLGENYHGPAGITNCFFVWVGEGASCVFVALACERSADDINGDGFPDIVLTKGRRGARMSGMWQGRFDISLVLSTAPSVTFPLEARSGLKYRESQFLRGFSERFVLCGEGEAAAFR